MIHSSRKKEQFNLKSLFANYKSLLKKYIYVESKVIT